MKSYAFALQKGGTGKTSISVTAAVTLARKGKKVVYIDCDPQGNSSSWLLNDFDNELADILYGDRGVLDCVYESDVENLYVIPTFGVGGRLKQFAWTEHYPFKFRTAILPVLEEHFDYCIFDTSPMFGEFEKSVFIACSEIIPVLRLDEFSKDGWEIFVKNMKPVEEQYGIKPVYNKIVLNQLDRRLKTQEAFLAAYDDVNADGSFHFFYMPTDQAFVKSQSMHSTIYDRETKAKAETVEAMNRLTEEME